MAAREIAAKAAEQELFKDSRSLFSTVVTTQVDRVRLQHSKDNDRNGGRNPMLVGSQEN